MIGQTRYEVEQMLRAHREHLYQYAHHDLTAKERDQKGTLRLHRCECRVEKGPHQSLLFYIKKVGRIEGHFYPKRLTDFYPGREIELVDIYEYGGRYKVVHTLWIGSEDSSYIVRIEVQKMKKKRKKELKHG